MKKLFSMAVALAFCTIAGAQTTQLPPPELKGGTPMMETLAKRHSERAFSDRTIDMQTLGNMLWAAVGVNRKDEGKRTNPTAMNRQEISVYVFTATEVSLYNAETHSLDRVAEGDHRKLVASRQDFVMQAPVSIVFVGDYAKMGIPGEKSKMMVAVDAGIACQNLNLFCASAGLATVPRATMDGEAIRQLLGLSEMQEPIMNNPVGYPAE